MQRTKKQHVVPQFYLRHFADDREKLWVYDKVTKRTFQANVSDVAQERCFYDVPVECIPPGLVEGDDPQLVEHRLALIENGLAKHVQAFLDDAETKPITEQQVLIFSFLIALQMMRTPEFRALMKEITYKTLTTASQNVLDRQFPDRSLKAVVEIKEDFWPVSQANLMFDLPALNLFLAILTNHIWVVGVNRTNRSLYTSDSPIIKRANIKDPFVGGGTGVASLGIEIHFPLSPTVVLSLVERTVFCNHLIHDRTVRPLDEENVIYLNDLQVAACHRQVYCSEKEFTLAERRCRESPAVCNPDRERVQRIYPNL